MFPLIPLLALGAILGGGYTLYWYSRLSREERERADRLAADYARDLFGKTLSQLTEAEAKRVHELTRRHFVN
jgi:hypothetical protein